MFLCRLPWIIHRRLRQIKAPIEDDIFHTALSPAAVTTANCVRTFLHPLNPKVCVKTFACVRVSPLPPRHFKEKHEQKKVFLDPLRAYLDLDAMINNPLSDTSHKTKTPPFTRLSTGTPRSTRATAEITSFH